MFIILEMIYNKQALLLRTDLGEHKPLDTHISLWMDYMNEGKDNSSISLFIDGMYYVYMTFTRYHVNIYGYL